MPITYKPNQPMSETDVEDINHAIHVYVKWHHLFMGMMGSMDKAAVETMFKPSVGAVWPQVYDVAYKAGQKHAKRWVFPVLGFAGYGLGSMVADVIKIFLHLSQ